MLTHPVARRIELWPLDKLIPYIIADNQLALNAGWDDEVLRAELVALQDEDFNVRLIGFEDEELARLLATQDATEGSPTRTLYVSYPEHRFRLRAISGF